MKAEETMIFRNFTQNAARRHKRGVLNPRDRNFRQVQSNSHSNTELERKHETRGPSH